MTFLLVFVMLAAIAAVIAWLLRKEAARRKAASLKEAEFIAAMRANPRGIKASATAAPVAPLVLGQAFGQTIDAPVADLSFPTGAAAVADIVVPNTGAPAPALNAGPVAAPAPSGRVLQAPRDGHCLVCGEAVDVRSNDAARWGVKIPEPGADRLSWVHFQCLSARLERGREASTILEQLVLTIEQHQQAFASAEGADLLAPALQRARAVLARPG